MEYNFNYIKELYLNMDKKSISSHHSQFYEMNTLLEGVDKKISGLVKSNIFHIVPIVYSCVFTIGCSVFVYKIFNA